VDHSAFVAKLRSTPGLELGRHYDHAPIVEAIVEFYVDAADDVTLDALAQLPLGEDYPEPAPMFTINTQLQVVDGEMTSESSEDRVGQIFNRRDQARTVVAGLDRFAFTSRGDYTDWETFIAEVERSWLIYKAAVNPSFISRAGVRFVNQIQLPARSVEIKDYLRTSVDISAYLPQAVSGLFMQVDIPIPDLGVDATLTSAMLTDNEANPGQHGLLLDIDVKMSLSLDARDPGFSNQLSRTLATLRLAKNYMFEACITDATRGLIS
jgi:uncharacterized protein (TIGR04255 family)